MLKIALRPLVVALWLTCSLYACGDDSSSPSDAGFDAALDAQGPIDRHDAAPSGEDDDAGDDEAAGDASVMGDAGPLADAGEQPPEPIAISTFCDQLADSICDWLTDCRSFVQCYEWPRWPGILASCAAAQDALAAGRIAYDGVEAARCIAGHRANGCTGAPPIVFADQNPGALEGDARSCANVFSGRIENGQDCYPGNVLAADECQDGSCHVVSGACPGTCEPLRELDQSCQPSAGQRCEPGLFCDDGTCAVVREEGDACTNGLGCRPGLYCVRVSAESQDYECHARVQHVGDACIAFGACPSGSSCYEGTCRDELPSGAECFTSEQCPEGERCVDDGDGTAVCRGKYALGEACVFSDFCTGDALCYNLDGDPEPICRARGDLGAPCQGDSCEEGLYCAFGAEPMCTPIGEDGEACDDAPNSCAAGLACMSDLKCHPPGELGEPCDEVRGSGCVDGLFCDLSTATCAMPAGAGGACSPRESTRSCVNGYYCDCVDQDGEGWCPDGITSPPPELYACVAQTANGTACTVDIQCISGNCAYNLKECAAPEAGEGAVLCTGP